MKVLDANPPRELWTIKVTCRELCGFEPGGCGAELLLNEDQIYLDKEKEIREYRKLCFTCPCCGQEMTVFDKKSNYLTVSDLPAQTRDHVTIKSLWKKSKHLKTPIEVLKPGREQNGWAVEQICTGRGVQGGGCGAKLLIEEADLIFVYKTYSNFWDGPYKVNVPHFDCPICKVKTKLQIRCSLPPHIKNGD